MKHSFSAIFLTMVMLISMVFFVQLPVALAEDNSYVDMIFLLNTCEIMNYADPERSAITAITQFINEIGVGSTRVGVIGNSWQIPLTALENEYVISELSALISSFEYADNGGRAQAMEAAVNMATTNTQNPVVVFVARGAMQASHDIPRGIPVYAVAVNYILGADEMVARFHLIFNNHRARIITTGLLPQEYEETSPMTNVTEEAPDYTYEELNHEDDEYEEESEYENEAEEEPTYTLLVFLAFASAIAAALSVYRFIKVVI